MFPVQATIPPTDVTALCYKTATNQPSHSSYLDDELLVGGPPLPSRLASPGPVSAPSPPSVNIKEEQV